MKQEATLRVGGKALRVSNLDKMLFPRARFTKAGVIDYYSRVSPYLLPHFKDRPVTLKRYPDGVSGESFWEKDVPGFAPEWVRTFAVSRKTERGEIHYILINDLKTLVWCANIAAIELHPFLHRVPGISRPTSIVFDLDPGPGADILTCAEVAFLLKDGLEALKLACFAKVSGSKGLQVHVPLNTPATYEQTRHFARVTAETLAGAHPDLVVAEMSRALRGGKIFIDWGQNLETKTTIGVYSLRAQREVPYASLPVSWEELEKALARGRSEPLYFEPEAAVQRLEKVGDLFAPVLELKQKLPAAAQTFPVKPPRRAGTVPAALRAYASKRNFRRTGEPAAGATGESPAPAPPRRSQQGGKRRFVVQKHAASHLHYDFRLETGQTLKSWAVPRNLPLEPGQARRGFQTEDHPLEYLTFEGVIPAGQYGGGTVMVWDTGTYEVVEGNVWKGRLQVFLEGSKLKGEWLMERQQGGEKPEWLIVRRGRPLQLKGGETSAMSGRTLEEIAQARDAVWTANRGDRAPDKDALPRFVPPMLARKVATLPKGAGWLYEWKWDGYRAMAIKQGEATHLLSRRGRDLTKVFPSVATTLKTLHAQQAIVDGEVVAINDRGEVSFQLLQNRGALPAGWHLLLCAFDLLYLEGEDLRRRPLEERRTRLERITAKSAVLFSAELEGTPARLIERGKRERREGIMAKRLGSVYETGGRSDAWRKLQLKPQQEFVVGGYRPQGKTGLELLLVGYYEAGKLLFAGKVRNELNAFNRKPLFELLHPLRAKDCPFANLPNSRRDHFGEGVTAEEMPDYVWVQPRVVVQVRFAEWTRSRVLRHAEFAGVREDKTAQEVVKEAGIRGVRERRRGEEAGAA